MSQILTENDDNRSVAASDFVQLDQADEVPNQQEEQQHQGQSQFGLHQSLDWTLETGSTHNNYENGNDFKEMKWMIANLQGTIQTLQEKMKNIELEAKIRAMEENAKQNAKYQALETKMNEVVQMLSTQNEEHRKEMAQLKDGFAKEMAQLEAKNRLLQEKLLSNVEVQTTKNGSKILANPKGIVWNRSKTNASISEFGLKTTGSGWVFATEGYAISAEHCRKENFHFSGTILFYYEVTITTSSWHYSVGFTDGSKTGSHFGSNDHCGVSPNSYGFERFGHKNDSLWLSGKQHKLECPNGVIAERDVLGCGLLLNSKNELAVFFTHNGILLGKQIRIYPTVNRLYPTVYTYYYATVEANFGDNLVAKPFQYDVDKCQGLVFE